MAKKKKEREAPQNKNNPNVMGLQAEVTEQAITETLESNYMPYAMSVIVSRAIPEIDGFKPSHRKLLYSMYKMGLLTGGRTKSANIVGSTMRLNPHGDAAIYETMVRLSKGYGALLTPFVDSKGNFGKVYSRDMSYAASRYTEAKLSDICRELFGEIDKDTVEMVDNYDGTMMEPSLLPTTFPNILVNSNIGIAVGMACNICGFNLSEVCQTTIDLLNDPNHDIMTTLPAPDFPTGGELIFNVDEMAEIYRTGKGSFRVRSKWRYVKEGNLIEVYEIPYTTTAEAVIDKIAELVKAGKLKEIADTRDETDLSGLKIAIDLKRGADPDKVMAKLFKLTTLMDSYPCNFNVLIAGTPRVMGVKELLEEWCAWRAECIKRRTYHELSGKKDKLHLLEGLQKILLDIDKAIAIIRNTEAEADVVPNLMIGFGIDEIQAEYVAEIKLRNINREYILKRTAELDELEKQIADLEDMVNSRRRIRSAMVAELKQVIKKYGEPRRTSIVYEDMVEVDEEDEGPESFPVTLFLSREGYFKKITAQSLRMSSEQKYKENDSLMQTFEADNTSEMLVFTDKCQVYKTRAADFESTKASALGTYLPSALGMDEGESVLCMILPGDYSGQLVFFYENGKAARVPLEGYVTKTNRRKLTGAYSDKSPLRSVLLLQGDLDLIAYTDEGRALIVNSSLIPLKTTRSTQGVAVVTLKKKYRLDRAELLKDSPIRNISRYRVRSIPAAGALLKQEDTEEQQMNLF